MWNLVKLENVSLSIHSAGQYINLELQLIPVFDSYSLLWQDYKKSFSKRFA